MDIMLDLETLSSSPDAAIVAIGAVTFLQTTDRKTFYRVIDAESSEKMGGRISANTIKWWMKQSDAARAIFTQESVCTIEQALIDFSKFCNQFDEGVAVWGNGASFDNVVMRQSYERHGLTAPWSFRGERCYRTLKNMYPSVHYENKGTAHNALDDALAQAHHAEAIFEHIMSLRNRAAFADSDDDTDLADFDTDEIAEEYHYRIGGNGLIGEALSAIRQGRSLDAATALERVLYPKWDSKAECQKAYDLAMGKAA